jgi:HK97 family phage portal protein
MDGLLSSFSNTFNSNSDGEIAITPKTSLRISTAFTCVLVSAESVGSLPCSVKQSTSKGTITAYHHSAYNLIHNKPNPFQNAIDFWKMVIALLLTEGEAIAIITFSGRWMPSRIDLIPCPKDVDIIVVDGRPWYRYNGVVYEDWRVLHFKDLSLDGIRGCSRIRYNADTLSHAAKLRIYGKRAIGNKPPGYFSTDAPYETVRTQIDNIAKAWKEKINAGDPPTVPFGLKYNPLMISPGDAQYLEAVKATKEEICGIFRIPPTFIQDYERATFANAEQQDIVFAKYTITPLITILEQECNAKLFAESNNTSAEPYYVKFNLGALLRGDFRTRTEGYRTLFNIGAIDGDTIAELEDWNKWEGGDRRFIQMNMMPLDKVDEVIASMTKEGAQPEAVKDDQQRTIGYRFKGMYMPLNEHHDGK